MTYRPPTKMGQITLCRHCRKVCTGFVYSQWNGFEFEVLDAWWSHFVHPLDNHDAEPPAFFLPEE